MSMQFSKILPIRCPRQLGFINEDRTSDLVSSTMRTMGAILGPCEIIAIHNATHANGFNRSTQLHP